nr:hypothetical protein [Stenotrophomonas acidaminiphila]
MEKHQQDLYGKAAASPARRRLWRRLGDAGRGRRPGRMRAGLGAGANLCLSYTSKPPTHPDRGDHGCRRSL